VLAANARLTSCLSERSSAPRRAVNTRTSTALALARLLPHLEEQFWQRPEQNWTPRFPTLGLRISEPAMRPETFATSRRCQTLEPPETALLTRPPSPSHVPYSGQSARSHVASRRRSRVVVLTSRTRGFLFVVTSVLQYVLLVLLRLRSHGSGISKNALRVASATHRYAASHSPPQTYITRKHRLSYSSGVSYVCWGRTGSLTKRAPTGLATRASDSRELRAYHTTFDVPPVRRIKVS